MRWDLTWIACTLTLRMFCSNGSSISSPGLTTRDPAACLVNPFVENPMPNPNAVYEASKTSAGPSRLTSKCLNAQAEVQQEPANPRLLGPYRGPVSYSMLLCYGADDWRAELELYTTLCQGGLSGVGATDSAQLRNLLARILAQTNGARFVPPHLVDPQASGTNRTIITQQQPLLTHSSRRGGFFGGVRLLAVPQVRATHDDSPYPKLQELHWAVWCSEYPLHPF